MILHYVALDYGFTACGVPVSSAGETTQIISAAECEVCIRNYEYAAMQKCTVHYKTKWDKEHGPVTVKTHHIELDLEVLIMTLKRDFRMDKERFDLTSLAAGHGFGLFYEGQIVSIEMGQKI